MARQVRCATLLVVFLALSAFGCGKSGPKVVPVSGTVTLDGRPLAEGLISFKTIQTGAVEAFDIKDGEFQGNAQAGDRRVEICLYRTITGDFNGMKGEVKENLIPARYNLESE